ncbi:Dual specificity mitogen-activated protein kinase kinase 1 [Smittium culicis]|uniref:Dual specificity mitogen-activated protein kinase kinase 1 n=1 Tax=Smittium culicis TaxID=133412 RepID=A0A1R1YET8_9FUNG|nr:Dual specificity mitogen-activated protein kinase kinase 1 [Smittium culicis]
MLPLSAPNQKIKKKGAPILPRVLIPKPGHSDFSPEYSSTAASRKQSRDRLEPCSIGNFGDDPENIDSIFENLSINHSISSTSISGYSKKKPTALVLPNGINTNSSSQSNSSSINFPSLNSFDNSSSYSVQLNTISEESNHRSNIYSHSSSSSLNNNKQKNTAVNSKAKARRNLVAGGESSCNDEDLSPTEEYTLNSDNIKIIDKLGEGSVGTVYKIMHIPTGKLMARKLVAVYPEESYHRQLVRELSFLKQCDSPSIVKFYGAYYSDTDDGQSICICMEYCDGGSLDNIYKKVGSVNGRIGEGVLGKVAEAVLDGLVYLHTNNIIHRVTGKGQIKLCDFGVSGELVDSIAQTFVGTSYYMAPERIQGAGYAIQSDIWSLGLTLLEVALNRFPFPSEGPAQLTVIELLDYIVRVPIPSLNSTQFSPEIISFVDSCLIKSPKKRPVPTTLQNHPFIIRSEMTKLDLESWIKQVWAS